MGPEPLIELICVAGLIIVLWCSVWATKRGR